MKHRLNLLLVLLSLSFLSLASCSPKAEKDTGLQSFSKKFNELHPNGYIMENGWYEINSTYSYGDVKDLEYKVLVINKAKLYLDFDKFGQSTSGTLPISEGIYSQNVITQEDTTSISMWLKNGESIIKEEKVSKQNGELSESNIYTTKINFFNYQFNDEYKSIGQFFKWKGDGSDNVNVSFQLGDNYLKYFKTDFTFFKESGYMGSNQTTEYYFFDSNLNIFKKEKHFDQTNEISQLSSSMRSGDVSLKPIDTIEIEYPSNAQPAQSIESYTINLENLFYPESN